MKEYDELFDRIVKIAKDTYERDGHHEPLLLPLLGTGLAARPIDVGPFLENEAGKDALARAVRSAAGITGINGYVLVTEAWLSQPDAARYVAATALPPSKDPERKEVLNVVMVSTAPTPRYARQCSIEIERGKVIELVADGRETPDNPLGGRFGSMLP